MNPIRSAALLPLLVLLCGALAAEASAQRPNPRPSQGSQSPRPAPSPRPSVTPRPSAPRPSATPAPRPAPAPVSRPQAPSHPRTEPRASTPRTTPVQTPVIPRQPDPIRTTPRTTPRAPTPIDTARPGESRITRPSTPTLPAPTTRVRTDVRPPTATDNVYRGRQPSTTITRPERREPTSREPNYRQPNYREPNYRETVRTPAATTPRTPEAAAPVLRPRPATERTSRFAPTDGTIAAPRPSVTPRTRTAPGTTNSAAARTPAATSTTPRLVPRSTAPSLGAPRSRATVNGATSAAVISGIGSPRASSARATVSGTRVYVGGSSDCHRSYWRTWWDPCHTNSWNWNWYGGCGSYGWNVSLWHPWFWFRSCWNDWYLDSWWCHRSQPYCVSTNYWWYPTSTYCPTYLYVPSSVVYVERDDAPAPAEGSTEVVVAGGAIARRAAEPVGDVGARGQPPEALAKKYVELGDFYFEVGRYAEAADAYARAKTYAPNNASVHLAMADAAFATGDYHFAAYLIAEAVRLDPAIVSAEIDRRVYYGDPKAFETQMSELERYLEAKPYDAQAHLVHGYNLRFSGKPVAAIGAFRRVVEITPENRAAQAFLTALAPPASEAVIR